MDVNPQPLTLRCHSLKLYGAIHSAIQTGIRLYYYYYYYYYNYYYYYYHYYYYYYYKAVVLYKNGFAAYDKERQERGFKYKNDDRLLEF